MPDLGMSLIIQPSISYREDDTLLDRLLITDNLEIDEGTLPPLAGDLSMDDKIDFEDFAILAEYWLEEQLWPEE